jgi:hypothetical protein
MLHVPRFDPGLTGMLHWHRNISHASRNSPPRLTSS